MNRRNDTQRPQRPNAALLLVALLALVAAVGLQLGCHGNSSGGVFSDELAGEGSGPTGSPTGPGGTDDSGSTDPDATDCLEGQVVMCIHEDGGSQHSGCVDGSDVLSQIYNQGDYEGACVENELRICHQDPAQAIPRAIWIPSSLWPLHQTHTNGLGGAAPFYDRILAPFESCAFGLDY